MKKIVCEFCGEKYDRAEPRCPHCGGRNREVLSFVEAAERPEAEAPPAEDSPKEGVRKPKTIYELQRFAADHDLPLRQMRVHLGEDYPGAKAYGIYQAEDGSFVVYKNKADGTRSVRYQGPDEACAVNELFLKMKELIEAQPARRAARAGRSTRSGGSGGSAGGAGGSGSWLDVVKRNFWKYLLILAICTVVWLLVSRAIRSARRPDTGYYRYDGDVYYYQNDSWYQYDGGWQPIYIDDGDDLAQDYDDYYQSEQFYGGYGVEDFADSDWFSGNQNQNAWNGGQDNGNGAWNWNDDQDDDGWNWNDDRDDWDDDGWDWDDDWDWDDGGWDDDWGWDDGGDWDSDW